MQERATSSKLDRSDRLAAVVAELGTWTQGRGPLYRQLARGLAGAIERGALVRDARLPAERSLAAALVVSRGTAVAAYDALVADGLVERRHGSGTYVAAGPSDDYPPGREGSELVHRLVDRSAGRTSLIDLSLSVLADASALPAVSVTDADLRRVVPDSGLSPWGLPSLRARLALHVAGWGLPTVADEIVVTTGAQQALSLATACWVRPGDVVVIDDPTYPGAIAAFAQAGAQLHAVPVDHEGPRPDALAAALIRHPALVYLQTGVHSPTGSVMSDRRGDQLARVLHRARVPLVEDRALADLAWGAAPSTPIAARLPGHATVVLGSLSKVVWGGLRIGFARASGPLALRLARIKATRDLGTSAVSQALAEQLLDALDGITRRQHRVLRSRAATLQNALTAALPEARWPVPEGGMSLWVTLPRPHADAFDLAARRHGVAVATARSLSTPTPMAVTRDYGVSATGAHRAAVRLSFSAGPTELREGARRLGAAWREVAAALG